jgi:hypothetical protein
MAEQSTPATDSPSQEASNGEIVAPAPLEQPSGESEQSAAPHTEPNEAESPPPASRAEELPYSEAPEDTAGAEAIAQPDEDEKGADTEGAEAIAQSVEDEAGPVGQEWEDLTGDGKILKRTVKQGSGSVPELHAVCLGVYFLLCMFARLLHWCRRLPTPQCLCKAGWLTETLNAVHYSGKHKDDGSVFVDTRDEREGKPVSIVAGRGAVHTAATEHYTSG